MVVEERHEKRLKDFNINIKSKFKDGEKVLERNTDHSKEDNIEYGILSYIRYLANYYYAQGLNTVESIGYKYCPSIDANGNKVTSPHWLSLVYRAKGVYANTNNDIKVDALVD